MPVVLPCFENGYDGINQYIHMYVYICIILYINLYIYIHIYKSVVTKDISLLKLAYTTFVRPLLEYNSATWSPHLHNIFLPLKMYSVTLLVVFTV